MGSLFSSCMTSSSTSNKDSSKHKTKKPTESDQVKLKLLNTRDLLARNRNSNQKQIDKQDIEIRQYLKNNQKDKARFAAQRMKLFQEFSNQIDTKYVVIQQMLLEVEKQQINSDMIQAIKQTNTFIENMREVNNMEDNLMQYQENRQIQDEHHKRVDEMCNNMGVNQEEVDAEFEKYLQQEQQQQAQQLNHQFNQIQQPNLNNQQLNQPQQYQVQQNRKEVMMDLA